MSLQNCREKKLWKEEKWLYFIDCLRPLSPISYRSRALVRIELPAGISKEAIRAKLAKPFRKEFCKIYDIRFMPTIEGTYRLENNMLIRLEDGCQYNTHGISVKGIRCRVFRIKGSKFEEF